MNIITLITWNVGGSKLFKAPFQERLDKKLAINNDVNHLIDRFKPEIILFQEVIKYEENGTYQEFISEHPDYYYQSFIAINTHHHNHPRKWQAIRRIGQWPTSAYLGQGNGIMWKKELLHALLWEPDPSKAKQGSILERNEVRIDTGERGLFNGDRDTEPRLAVVSKFIINQRELCIVNLHMTTLKGEREDLPNRDDLASTIRMKQVDIVLNGIVSRYNEWKRTQEITYPTIWILGGDFNAQPDSPEIQKLHRMNFIDLCTEKGKGSKCRVNTDKPLITVDYLFAGMKHSSFDPFDPSDISLNLLKKTPIYEIISSDHYPLVGQFPLNTFRST